MKKDKHFWAIYYGIDEKLSYDEFYREIEKINQDIEQLLIKMGY